LTGIPKGPRGQPQIEVTFEVDTNSILSVSAIEKGSGKVEKIVITNDKGRLSQEEIDRMLKEAEEFAEQDKVAKERIDARNAFENYVYSMKNTVEDPEKLADKITDDEKETIKDAVKEAQEWLSSHQDAEKEEFEEQQKALEKICNPIVSKAYQASGHSSANDDAGADEL